MTNLFYSDKSEQIPLAEKMRPETLEEVFGQEHLLGENGFLSQIIKTKQIPSMVFWGPPGTGKTTLARIISNYSNFQFITFSAVTSGIPEIKKLLKSIQLQNKTVLLFIDEIHRFNKLQQDAFLPYIENGTIIMIGATTENPSFELNRALLSRLKVLVLNPLSESALKNILKKAISDPNKNLMPKDSISDNILDLMASYASGDARNALNLLEILNTIYQADKKSITHKQVLSVIQKKIPKYDKNGEYHYDLISALHKSLRGSDTDAALYYLMRMVDAGEDPKYLTRRLVRFASEDIGLADPFALVLAQNTMQACNSIGYPECDVILAELVIYLALAPKSNSVYSAVKALRKELAQNPLEEVPMFIRNAPTKLMKNLGYGKNYIYPHNTPDGFVKTQYLPKILQGKEFYKPTNRGKEKQFSEKLTLLRKRLKNEN
ncbi:MAG: replication-associated recombination protein A [Caldisericia bacterium]|nr:replication-associated recombination protein A [Caldisericia bacterium]